MNAVGLSSRKRGVTLICSVLMVLSFLAPTVSRALSAQGQIGWVQACNQQGTQWVLMGSALGDDSINDLGFASPDASIDRCPLCILIANPSAPFVQALSLPALSWATIMQVPIPPATPSMTANMASPPPPRGPPLLRDSLFDLF